MRFLIALCVFALAAAPAFAEGGQGARPRLVGGSIDLLKTDFAQGGGAAAGKTEFFGNDGFSAGAITGPEKLSLGGYASYFFNDVRVTSSLTTDGLGRSAALDAAYFGAMFGVDGKASVRLGYDWSGQGGFSPNPAQMGVNVFDGYRPGSDLSLSLSLSHNVTPAFSLGGFAAATHGETESFKTQSDFTLGAGLGLKF